MADQFVTHCAEHSTTLTQPLHDVHDVSRSACACANHYR